MRLARICISATALALGAVVVSAGGAAAASPCAPGQPPGRAPGGPPNQPMPPSRPPQYPPGLCQLQLSTAAAAPRTSVTAAGDGYAAGSAVSMRLGADSVATATTGADGRFTQTFTVPADATPGRYDVRATGTGAGGAAYEQAATLEVLPVQAQPQAAAGPVLQGGTLRSGAGLAAAPQSGSGATNAFTGMPPGVVAGGGLLPGVIAGGTNAQESVGSTGRLVPVQPVGGVGVSGPGSSGGFNPLFAVGAGLLLAGIGAGTAMAARRRSAAKP